MEVLNLTGEPICKFISNKMCGCVPKHISFDTFDSLALQKDSEICIAVHSFVVVTCFI